MEKNNSIRNINADKERLEGLKKFNFFSFISSDIFGQVSKYYFKHIKLILFIVFILSIQAALESIKTVLILFFLNSSFGEQFQLSGLMQKVVVFFKFSDSPNNLFYLLISFIVSCCIISVIKWFSTVLMAKIQLDFMRRLRTDLYNKIVSLDVQYFSMAKSGELLFMMNAEVTRFANTFIYLRSFITSFFNCIFIGALLFILNIKVTCFLFLFVAAIMYCYKFFLKKLSIRSWESNQLANTLSHKFHEIVYAIKLIKFAGLEERELQDYLTIHHDFEIKEKSIAKYRAFNAVYKDFIFILILVFFVLVFKFLNLSDTVKLSSSFIVAYMVILMRFLPFASEMQGAMVAFVTAYGPLKKISEVLSLKSSVESIADESLLEIQSINIENVSLTISSNIILNDVSVLFERSKRYAIVGFSGSGKSTLLDLIVGLRKADSGKVKINNKDINILNKKSLRDKIGYMNQEPLIFHDSMKENIMFFNRNVKDNEIDDSVKLSCLESFIDSREEGLGTMLGERGVSVSGGEKQRIGIARVLLKQFDLLLLDEATNALDYETEAKIYSNISKRYSDSTIIAVAHRLSAITEFDEILVMNKGKIVERGSHKDLMNRQGLYFNLYSLQAVE